MERPTPALSQGEREFAVARLGTFLERADATARILDVKYHILLPRVEDVGGALDYYQWAALLKSATAAFDELHAASSATPAQTATDSVISRRARRRAAEGVTELVFIGCPRFVVTCGRRAYSLRSASISVQRSTEVTPATARKSLMTIERRVGRGIQRATFRAAARCSGVAAIGVAAIGVAQRRGAPRRRS